MLSPAIALPHSVIHGFSFLTFSATSLVTTFHNTHRIMIPIYELCDHDLRSTTILELFGIKRLVTCKCSLANSFVSRRSLTIGHC